MLASSLCRDVPGFVPVALEILGHRKTRADWRTWLERLMLIHAFDRAREDRADAADHDRMLAALFRRPRRP